MAASAQLAFNMLGLTSGRARNFPGTLRIICIQASPKLCTATVLSDIMFSLKQMQSGTHGKLEDLRNIGLVGFVVKFAIPKAQGARRNVKRLLAATPWSASPTRASDLVPQQGLEGLSSSPTASDSDCGCSNKWSPWQQKASGAKD